MKLKHQDGGYETSIPPGVLEDPDCPALKSERIGSVLQKGTGIRNLNMAAVRSLFVCSDWLLCDDKREPSACQCLLGWVDTRPIDRPWQALVGGGSRLRGCENGCHRHF